MYGTNVMPAVIFDAV